MRPMKRVRRIFVGGSLVAVIGTVGIGPVMAKTVTPPASAPKPARGAAPWAAPADPLRLIFAAGLRPERKETLIHHVHSHLDVFVNGARVIVPAGIGINIRDPGVKRFKAPDGSTAYGGIQLCSKPCISPLHTHDDTGILHTESASAVPNRLGQLFTEWGVRLSRACVGGYCRHVSIQIFVNGKRYSNDPRTILLTNHKEIAVVIGTQPKTIPSKATSQTPERHRPEEQVVAGSSSGTRTAAAGSASRRERLGRQHQPVPDAPLVEHVRGVGYGRDLPAQARSV